MSTLARWIKQKVVTRRNMWLAVCLFLFGLIASIFLKVGSEDLRLDVTSGYVSMEFTRGVLFTPPAQEITLFDVKSSDASNDGAVGDVRAVASSSEQTVAVSALELVGSKRRMSVEALKPSEPIVTLHPQEASVTLALAGGGSLYGPGSNTKGGAKTYQRPAFLEYLPANDRLAIGLKNVVKNGAVFRTRELTALSFVNDSSSKLGDFSEILQAKLLFPDINERLLNLTRGETIRINFTEPAELSLSFDSNGVNVVAFGNVDLLELGGVRSSRNALPSWLERLSSLPLVQAIAVLMSGILANLFLDQI